MRCYWIKPQSVIPSGTPIRRIPPGVSGMPLDVMLSEEANRLLDLEDSDDVS